MNKMIKIDVSKTSYVKKEISKRNKKRSIANYRTEHLVKWLKNENFELDESSCKTYINNKYSINHLNSKGSIKKVINKRNKRLDSIKRFSDIELNYSREGKDDRLHTYFTTFPSDLKKFITFKGEKLVEFDLKSSQPFICTVLLEIIKNTYEESIKIKDRRKSRLENKIFKRLKFKIRKLLHKEEIYTNYKIDIDKICYDITIMLLKGAPSTMIKEIQQFVFDVRHGDIYEKVGKCLFSTGTIIKKENQFVVKLFDKNFKMNNGKKGIIRKIYFKTLRDCSKKITLNSIYSSSIRKNGNGPVSGFRKIYPETMKVLDVFKSYNSSDLPILMQRIESFGILDVCSKKIARKLPNVPIITRHDSISTTKSCSAEVKILFQQYLDEFFGVKANVKESIW